MNDHTTAVVRARFYTEYKMPLSTTVTSTTEHLTYDVLFAVRPEDFLFTGRTKIRGIVIPRGGRHRSSKPPTADAVENKPNIAFISSARQPLTAERVNGSSSSTRASRSAGLSISTLAGSAAAVANDSKGCWTSC